MSHSLMPRWLSSSLLVLSILLFLAAWVVTAMAVWLGPSSSTHVARLLLWRVAPLLGGSALVLGLGGIAGRFVSV